MMLALLLLAGLLVTGFAYAAANPRAAGADTAGAGSIDNGKKLFLVQLRHLPRPQRPGQQRRADADRRGRG